MKLKRDIDVDHLNHLAETEFYSYLESKPFKENFVSLVGSFADSVGGSCLDVGCGSGILSQYTRCRYIGFDASNEAINLAVKKYSRDGARFVVARLEDPPEVKVDCVVFGNVLSVIVGKDSVLECLEKYQELTGASHFIVYDLIRFDTGFISARHKLIRSCSRIIQDEGLKIPKVKLARKVMVYRYAGLHSRGV